MIAWDKPIVTRSPDQTRRLAADLAPTFTPGTVLALRGQLGSGKTCFVQGLAEALRIPVPVTSPTFSLVNEYRDGLLPLFHVDLYRIASADEALDIGIEELLDSGGITAIEWPDCLGDLLEDRPVVQIDFHIQRGDMSRSIVLKRSPL